MHQCQGVKGDLSYSDRPRCRDSPCIDLVPTPLVMEPLLGDLDPVQIHHTDDVVEGTVQTWISG